MSEDREKMGGKETGEKNRNLEEINQYEDYAFPIEIFTVTRDSIVPRGRGFLDLHWHTELQFSYVVKGSMTMQANGTAYPITAGNAIFINRNILHETTELSDDGVYISLLFPEKLLGFFTGSRLEQDCVLPYTANYSMPAVPLDSSAGWQSEVLDVLRRIIRLCGELKSGEERPPAEEYRIAVNLVEMWYLLIRHAEFGETATGSYLHKQERIRVMLSYIHQHYMEPIHLEDIAAAASVSKGECCRCFKEMIRQSTSQYLITYRIVQSMELLTKTDSAITEIADQCGFNDASHFTHCFKNRIGMTPKEYRNLNKV